MCRLGRRGPLRILAALALTASACATPALTTDASAPGDASRPAWADAGPPLHDGGADAPTQGALVLPETISLPYVVAGGTSQLEVTISNPGDRDVTGVMFTLSGAAGLTLGTVPDVVPARESVSFLVSYASGPEEEIVSAVLRAESSTSVATADVFGVAGDPALGVASFDALMGAGGVVLGAATTVELPTAPYPDRSRTFTDDRVHVFLPEGYRERDAHDIVLHFHGHNSTVAATLTTHRYREHLYASGVDAILEVPQGPVNTPSGDFGKLMDPDGTAALLQEVLVLLYREGRLTRPVLGEVTLTSHSGGYWAVARNLTSDAPFYVAQAGLYDSIHAHESIYRDFAVSGGRLRSNYTDGAGKADNNRNLMTMLDAAGVVYATEATQATLRDSSTVIYRAATNHRGATRLENAYGEHLRWGLRHSRRGPRIDLREAIVEGGVATVRWLAPHDDDVTGYRVQTSPDGIVWTTAAEAGPEDDEVSFVSAGAVRVRVVSVLDGVMDPLPSDVYRIDDAPTTLVVDAFDRVIDGSWGGLSHDFAARVGDAVGSVATVSRAAITEGGHDLSRWRRVIWLLGDEASADHTFTAAERALVAAYVAGGGHLVVSGSEVGHELDPVAATFLAETLGAVFESDDAGALAVSGEGLGATSFAGPGAPYAEESPDSFRPTSEARVILRYAGGQGAAVGLPGRSAIVGFPLELVDTPAGMRDVVGALIDFVDPR